MSHLFSFVRYVVDILPFLVKLPTAMCFLVSRAAIFTTNFRQKAIWGWKTVYANKNWWGTLCISTGKAEQCREGLRTNALPYSTRSVVGSRHCYFLQQNPPTWINGAILEIMTISKRQSVVSAGSHEHKIDLSCRGRRSDMNLLCLNRLGLVFSGEFRGHFWWIFVNTFLIVMNLTQT